MFSNWLNKPERYMINDKRIIIDAPAKTDFFADPLSDYLLANAPLFYNNISGDFTFSCTIIPEFKSTYDAGAILFYTDNMHWIKFAFENTDLGYPAVVSVATNKKSDDCNGEKIESESLAVKISRKQSVLGLYYSPNNSDWKMARLLPLLYKSQSKELLGISAQSPTGDGCRVIFENCQYKNTPVNDFRKGV